MHSVRYVVWSLCVLHSSHGIIASLSSTLTKVEWSQCSTEVFLARPSFSRTALWK